MFRTLIAAATFAAVSFAVVPAVHAEDQFNQFAVDQADQVGADQPLGQDRLMIVNGNSGRVIYDDGRNDLFCVTRVVFAGYIQWGRPLYRRTMRCR